MNHSKKQSGEDLSFLARGVALSPTLAVDAKAKELIATGQDVCGFGAGEPDFDTPLFIKEACVQALHEGKTKYSPVGGLYALREALAEKYRSRGISWATPECIVISPGGKFSCYLAVLALCNPGDEVIIAAPYWVSYPEIAKLAGAVPKIINARENAHFKVTPEELRAAISERTRLFILNSPSNPTGSVYSREEIKALLQVALEKNIFILSDEIYEYLLYEGVSHVSAVSLAQEARERVITVSGFSKTFSMTGWRLGTLFAKETIAKAIIRLQGHMTSNATTFAQYGALASLVETKEAERALEEMLRVFDRRRRRLWQGLSEIAGLTCFRGCGAFYLFPHIGRFGLSSSEFASRLLDEEKVALVPGVAFGVDEYVRLSYATADEVIEKGIERLKRFCEGLLKT